MAAAHSMSSHRRAMIGKVHVAKKELGLDDDSYAAVIARAANGKLSSADCTDAELVSVVEEFRRLGWQAKPRNPSTGSAQTGKRAADHKTARKARALWISLWQLGAIENASEKALEAFATRQLGCDQMQWADQTKMFKLIEALKAMALRHGWDATGPLKSIKERLLIAILAKLKAKGFAGDGWDVATAAERIAGFRHPRNYAHPSMWELGDIDMVAGAFGRLLNEGTREQ